MSVLHAFTGAEDGSLPQPGLVVTSTGTLYGLTQLNGNAEDGAGFGYGGFFELAQ